ncbi:hypothetical protein H6P81_007370 [Aristolochia fimbriata]|uniref:Cytochrome P450 n=1 Tax=Aristolochia fimbriata TaxID=158543 RepID=A0AAV7F2T9_ARIFI|nr:hypothetical protein H6P81_007370 [Aristolochia fimbriata]
MDKTQTLCVSLLLPLLVLVFIFVTKKKKKMMVRLPPGPRGLPILGNMHQLSEWPHRSLHSLAQIHGPLMYLKLGSVPVLAVSSADAARDIIKDHDMDFTGRPAGTASKKLSYGCLDVVFSPYGEYWRHVRKICAQELLSAHRVHSFRSLREREVHKMLRRVADDAEGRVVINLSEVLLSLTNGIICNAAFGTAAHAGSSTSSSSGRFQGIMGESKAVVTGLGVTDFLPFLEWINDLNGYNRKLDRVFRSLDKFFDDVIDEHLDPRRAPPEQEDFVDVMLRLQKEPNQGGLTHLSRNHVKAVIMVRYVPSGNGHNLREPDLDDDGASEEPDSDEKGTGRSERGVRGEEEGGRRRSPPFGILETGVEGSVKAASTGPTAGPARVHPTMPGQWLRRSAQDEGARQRVVDHEGPTMVGQPGSIHPGEIHDQRGGSCPGMNFGLATLELALASLLYSFDWGLPEGVKKEDIDMTEAPGLALHKKAPLFLVATAPKHVRIRPADL